MQNFLVKVNCLVQYAIWIFTIKLVNPLRGKGTPGLITNGQIKSSAISQNKMLCAPFPFIMGLKVQKSKALAGYIILSVKQ